MFWICDDNVDNTGRFYLLPSIKGLYCFSPQLTNKCAGNAKKVGWDRARTADPRDNLEHTASCSAYKAVEKEQIFRGMAFVFPSHHCA